MFQTKTSDNVLGIVKLRINYSTVTFTTETVWIFYLAVSWFSWSVTLTGGGRTLDEIIQINKLLIFYCLPNKPKGLKVAKEDQMADGHDGWWAWWPMSMMANGHDGRWVWWPTGMMADGHDGWWAWWLMGMMADGHDGQWAWWPIGMIADRHDGRFWEAEGFWLLTN